MHTIVSPQPLAAAIAPREPTTTPLMPPSIYLFPDLTPPMNSPRVLLAPPRLKSPIHLADSGLRPSPLIPKSPCTTPRYRGARPAHSPHRRRHCPHVDCHIESMPHLFDQLPWLSALDLSPDQISLRDIADLSELVVENSAPSHVPAAGPGPIRRRKTSLRSSPLTSVIECCAADSSLAGSIPFPFRETSNRSPTPRTRITPSRVRFHNLMPTLSCDSRNDESNVLIRP